MSFHTKTPVLCHGFILKVWVVLRNSDYKIGTGNQIPGEREWENRGKNWACEKEGMGRSKMGASETKMKATGGKLKKKSHRWVEITVPHSSVTFFIFISPHPTQSVHLSGYSCLTWCHSARATCFDESRTWIQQPLWALRKHRVAQQGFLQALLF